MTVTECMDSIAGNKSSLRCALQKANPLNCCPDNAAIQDYFCWYVAGEQDEEAQCFSLTS